MNIFVMRHARSVVNENKSLYDTYRDEDAPLSENGIKYFHEQVESIINKIEKSMGVYNYINVYCSPYKRTLDTYELLKPYFEKSSFTINHFEINPLLIEHIGYYFYNSEDFPLYVEGLRKYGSKFYYKYKNGESGVDVYNRVTTFFNYLGKNKPNTLLITHGYTMNVIDMYMNKLTPKEFDVMKYPRNCELRKYYLPK